MLGRRSSPEIMDDVSIQDERIDRALVELSLVNRFLGGRSTTRAGLRILRRNRRLEHVLTVLDVGAGGADVFGSGREEYAIIALDGNPRTCSFLRERAHPTIICGDALALPLKERSVDAVHASLFLHHFKEEEIERLLLSFSRVARHAIIFNDLRRSVFAYIGIWILTRVFSHSAMVKHDGPLSVLRGFTRRELSTMLRNCGFTNVVIRRQWAFRWLVVIELESRQIVSG